MLTGSYDHYALITNTSDYGGPLLGLIQLQAHTNLTLMCCKFCISCTFSLVIC